MTEAHYTYACDIEGEPATCWLAQFMETPCWGRLEKAHIISKQVIRRELRTKVYEEDWRGDLADAVWDARVWRPACQAHHHQLDQSRKLRIPRASIPAATEDFAREFGLTWWLDRTYGPVPERSAV